MTATIRQAKSWRVAMSEHGVDVDAAIHTLDLACGQPGIPSDEEIALAEIALRHSADMFTAGKLSQAIQYGREARALTDSLRKELALIPVVVRDNARQEGPRKPRGSRRLLLDQWLSDKLSGRPGLSNNELWDQLPQHDFGDGLYLDGDEIIELSGYGYEDGNARPRKPLKREGFDKRVTAARKNLSPVRK